MRPIYQNQKTNPHQFQKDCHHQDTLSFACPQFFNENGLKILANKICYHKQVKN